MSNKLIVLRLFHIEVALYRQLVESGLWTILTKTFKKAE